MVVGEVSLLIDRSDLKLVGSHLIMASFSGDSEAMSFRFEVDHESLDAAGDSSEIVVFELLVFRRLMPHEGATGHHEVGASGI